jgi:D-amino peptidase
MKICLSADMEGISQITNPLEVKAFCPQYWESGRAHMNDDVKAAARGLLDGGATEVVVLDNHGSGNTYNIIAEELPDRTRLETWNVFELQERGIEGMLQIGYHPHCGPAGFISHTYVGGLRLRVNGEYISESHGRCWGSNVPLLGIIGNDTHAGSLGSLAGAPYLVVQHTQDRGAAMPAHRDADTSHAAIREFAESAVENFDAAPRFAPPTDVLFEASMPLGMSDSDVMKKAGWHQRSTTEFEVKLATWPDARQPLAAAMAATATPYRKYFSAGEIRTFELFRNSEDQTLAEATRAFAGWIAEEQADWISGEPLPSSDARAT